MRTISATIEINGQVYDAFTGASLARPVHTLKKNIDGILPKDQASEFLAAAAAKLEQPPLKPVVTSPSMQDVVRSINVLTPHTPQTTRTLMRSSVSKPKVAPKKQIKIQPPVTTHTPMHHHHIEVKVAASKIHPAHLARAQQTSRSRAVHRFQPSHHSTFEPALPPAPHTPPAKHPTAHAANTRPLISAREELLAKALREATSHLQPAPHKQRKLTKQAALLTVSFAAFIVLAGGLASYNLSAAKMYIASSKAGFSAALPSYKPAGYHLNNISANAGEVASNFLSKPGQPGYQLTEKPSQWDSTALLNQFVEKNAGSYQTVAASGQTLYLYGNNQATWVRGGVWYQLQGKSSLTDKQLVDLALSL